MPLFALVKDEAKEVQQKLGGQNGGGAALIVIGRDFDQINPDDVMPFGDLLKDFQNIVV